MPTTVFPGRAMATVQSYVQEQSDETSYCCRRGEDHLYHAVELFKKPEISIRSETEKHKRISRNQYQ